MAFFFLFDIAICLSSLGITNIHAHLLGFSMDLINRDSPNSPLFDPEETQNQRFVKALHRSWNREHHFNKESSMTSPDNVQSEIAFYQGEYLIRIAIGLPPTSILAAADTGSDLIWTQCKPCNQCLNQETPPFDPTKSSTYVNLLCNSTKCQSIPSTHCSFDGKKLCNYAIDYGDDSFTRGNIAQDTITLGSTIKLPVLLPNAIIGCGHNNRGSTFTSKVTGIVGLGGGSISLISQLSPLIGGFKFSYCLVPYTSLENANSSKLNFGLKAEVSGEGFQVTPLVTKTRKTFYYVTLEAISVENQRIKFVGSNITNGNMVIDTGTTMTLLPGELYVQVESAVDSVVRGKRFEAPSGFPRLCYYEDSVVKFPEITLHFTGANLKLTTTNTFVNASDEIKCFSFNPLSTAGIDFAVLGNLAQTNFLIGYDRERQTVAFKPTDCSKET